MNINEGKVRMKILCDCCGDETEIWVDPDDLGIDPPYICDACETAILCDEDPETSSG